VGHFPQFGLGEGMRSPNAPVNETRAKVVSFAFGRCRHGSAFRANLDGVVCRLAGGQSMAERLMNCRNASRPS